MPVSRVALRRPGPGSDDVQAAFDAHRAELYAFALRSVREPEWAEDIVQEAYLRLVGEARRTGMPANGRAWLYRVVANLTVSRARRLNSALRWLRLNRPAPVELSPEDVAVRREEHADLEAALGRLPRDARVGLLLAAKGFSGREIAEALGRSEGATRSMLSRARLRLRSELGDPAD